MTLIEFSQKLLNQLWAIYASKVPYAKTYRDILNSYKATFVNDHVAFHSLKCTVKGRSLGLDIAAPIFLSLGYKEGEAIDFPDQKLFTKYFLPPHPDLPRVFISELLIDKLSPESAKLIKDSVASFKPILSGSDIQQLEKVPALSNAEIDSLLKKVVSSSPPANGNRHRNLQSEKSILRASMAPGFFCTDTPSIISPVPSIILRFRKLMISKNWSPN